MKTKFYRNINDLWHFFGPLIYTFLFFLLASAVYSKGYVTGWETFFLSWLFINAVAAPFWWEYWDKFKVVNYDPRIAVERWTAWQKSLFSSEGVADKKDLKLGLFGVFCGGILYGLVSGFIV